MSLEELVLQYGYLAVFVGCLLEGETILVLAGFAAHQGYLSLSTTLWVAFVGGTLGDQIFFWVGRRWGRDLLGRIPRAQPRVERVNQLLQRYHAPVIVGIRFMYGLRIVGPIVIGASDVSVWRLLFFNVLGAAIWAPLIGGLGYLFGHALALLLEDVRRAELAALILIVGFGIGVFVVQRWRSRADG
ncbi:MAG TPA: DedA family protein [Burkholderiaceae bacterium]|nr:DedA family protein [Burkholderiaceae bacterium]